MARFVFEQPLNLVDSWFRDIDFGPVGVPEDDNFCLWYIHIIYSVLLPSVGGALAPAGCL